MKWATEYEAELPPQASPVDRSYAKGLLLPSQYVLVTARGVEPPDKLADAVIDNFDAQVNPASQKTLQENLERMAESLREDRVRVKTNNIAAAQKIPAQTLRLLGVSKQIYVRMADVFSQASLVAPDLANDANATL